MQLCQIISPNSEKQVPFGANEHNHAKRYLKIRAQNAKDHPTEAYLGVRFFRIGHKVPFPIVSYITETLYFLVILNKLRCNAHF